MKLMVIEALAQGQCIKEVLFVNGIKSLFNCLFFRREQSLDKKYQGCFKHPGSRQSASSNSMEKLMKKRNIPQKLPSHSKR